MPDVSRTPFAEWISVSMDNAGLSGRKLAKKLGVHDTNISHWKSGKAVPSVDTLRKIAQTFEVPYSRLLVTARPDEFPPNEFGEPLPVPEKLAYRKRIRKHIEQAPGLDPRDARDVETVLALAYEIRNSDGDATEELHKAAEALDVIRRVIRGRQGVAE